MANIIKEYIGLNTLLTNVPRYLPILLNIPDPTVTFEYALTVKVVWLAPLLQCTALTPAMPRQLADTSERFLALPFSAKVANSSMSTRPLWSNSFFAPVGATARIIRPFVCKNRTVSEIDSAVHIYICHRPNVTPVSRRVFALR